MSFRELVKSAQSKLGYSRAELADALGVSPHTLDSWMKSEDTASHRTPPEWVETYLDVLVTGRPITYIQGDIAITYQRKQDL